MLTARTYIVLEVDEIGVVKAVKALFKEMGISEAGLSRLFGHARRGCSSSKLVAGVTVEPRAPGIQPQYDIELNLCWWTAKNVLVFYPANTTVVPLL